MTETKFIVGIDEAGRGPLAGPVAVGAVILSKDFDKKLVREIKNKDSKKLSETQREMWFEKIKVWQKQEMLNFHVALVNNTIIDTKGISFAIRKGIVECLKKIDADCDACEILLDGSLKAPKHFKKQKTVIKGDEKHFQISLASIVAKVTRDRRMEKLSIKYPEYGFDVHKGYGTYEHRKLIKKLGPSKIHRVSFLKNIV